MTSPLAVVRSPGLSTVQDGGRAGLGAVGVPRSGALHTERYLVATALISGVPDPRIPAVELLEGTLELEVVRDVAVAVVGPADVAVDGQPMAGGATVMAAAGSRWSVSWRGPGPSYVAVSGWAPSTVLGSAATDTFSRLGGAVLATGYVLVGDQHPDWDTRIGAFHRALPRESGPIRIVDVGDPRIDAFTGVGWTVQATSRSGVRLMPGSLVGAGTIASNPTLPGAIQLTPSGEPIILGPDGGITGGYPVIGVVTTVDRDRLSAVSPGDEVAFRVVTVEEAAAAHARRQARLRSSMAHVDTLA
ncbi:MAG: hypothetical protein GC156_16120 [Actinomycetales bacterium]|nr:hypothetical protein [Actinomycetales bacterium]